MGKLPNISEDEYHLMFFMLNKHHFRKEERKMSQEEKPLLLQCPSTSLHSQSLTLV
jgi:hypothetical protein